MALDQAQPQAAHLRITFIAPDSLAAVEEEARLHKVRRLALGAGRLTVEALYQIDGADRLASAVPRVSMRKMNPFYSP
jgi:hypothetical protein